MKNTVLVIDNDPGIIMAFKIMLLTKNYTTLNSSSPQEVFRLISIKKPEIIIFNMKFQKPLTPDFLCRIKERFPSLPIIVITAYTNTFSRQYVLQLGADDYFKMPFQINEMLKKIGQFAAGQQ